MSGGSWDYFCYKMQDAGERLLREKDPYRRALGEKMLLFADAMHDIEWVDSGDWGPGDEIPAIKKALGEGAPSLAFNKLLGDAEKLIAELRSFVE